MTTLRDAAESATAGVPVVYWAVHSRTGVHIGLWPDADDASKVFLEEYSDGTLTKLVPASELDTARAEIERLRGERDEAHKAARALTKALVGLTPGGSEYFTRSTVLDDYFADIERCVTVVRERFNSGHQAKIERLGDRRRTGGATHPTPSAHFPSPQESTSHDDRD